MRKILAILIPLFLLISSRVMAQTQNHGITFTVSDTSAAACTSTASPPCAGTYLVFEGPSAGNEVMTTPSATFTASTWTDNESTICVNLP
jgi:hypothetical protein